ALHVQALEGEIEVVRGVRDRRPHDAAERERGRLRKVLEDRDRLLGRLAGDKVGHEPRLPWRQPQELRARLHFHVRRPPSRSSRARARRRSPPAPDPSSPRSWPPRPRRGRARGFLRVFRPIAGLPQGVRAMPPTGDLASPPPCGWSRGDITTPRTCGRQPMRRLWPAPPILRFSWSMFPSCPTVARQRTWTTRMPPEGSRICAYSPSFATSCAAPPAARTSCAPRPGCNSTPWIWVPVGMCSSGRQFPTRASASGPETTVSPTLRSFGARM